MLLLLFSRQGLVNLLNCPGWARTWSIVLPKQTQGWNFGSSCLSLSVRGLETSSTARGFISHPLDPTLLLIKGCLCYCQLYYYWGCLQVWAIKVTIRDRPTPYIFSFSEFYTSSIKLSVFVLSFYSHTMCQSYSSFKANSNNNLSLKFSF